jgi:DNA-binding CsgD family transcriptional regulator
LRFAGPVDLFAARDLGRAAGYDHELLGWFADEARRVGAVERIDGIVTLAGEPARDVVLPWLRGVMAACDPDWVDAASEFALQAPAVAEELSHEVRRATTDLVAFGLVERQTSGRLGFRSPAIADGMRRFASDALAARVYRRALEGTRYEPAAVLWMLAAGEPIAAAVIVDAADRLAEGGEWQQVLRLVDLVFAQQASGLERSAAATAARGDVAAADVGAPDARASDAGAPGASGAVRDGLRQASERLGVAERARLRMRAATAARMRFDTAESVARIDDAAAEAAAADDPAAAELRAEIAVARAEILHYGSGSLDAALGELADDVALPAAQRALLAAHRVLHLGYGGRTRLAAEEARRTAALRRTASPLLRLRVHVVEALALSAAGQPEAGLRRSLALSAAARELPAAEAAAAQEALRVAITVTALNCNGPAAYAQLLTYVSDTSAHPDGPELIRYFFARAGWELACGRVAEARALAEKTLRATERTDPSGLAPAVLVTVGVTAALQGELDIAAEMLRRFEKARARGTAVIGGGLQSGAAQLRFLLGRREAMPLLRESVDAFVAEGQYGYAAEALFSGVRFGKQEAAGALLGFAPHLDGTLHALRVDLARALVDDDPVAIFTAAEGFEAAGLAVYAAEAAASVVRHPGVPDTVRRRAGVMARAAIDQFGLEHHPLMRGVPGGEGTPLTPREQQVARHIAEGLSNEEIAARWGVSPRTVEGHITRLYRKTGERRRSPGRR